jgi:hypothetical protein
MDMRKIRGVITVVLGTAFFTIGCQKSEVVSQFTGNETTYALQQASQYAITGTVTFKERKDGQVTGVISLSGISGDVKYPVHLHLGDIATPDANVALLMNPVQGSTGKSETTFGALSDESSIDYQKLVSLQACVKIHLGDVGSARNTVLAAGNIGSASTETVSGGRLGVAVCKSE